MTVQDVGDEDQVTTKKQVKKYDRDQELENLRTLLSTPGGREFYWRLLSQCNLFRPSYVPGDTHAMALNEGKRAIGLWAMVELSQSLPSAYDKMRIEAEERERK